MTTDARSASARPDPLREALAEGSLVFCEEVARDGAQAKTLLDVDQRIAIARRHAAILGEGAFGRLVFAAGFPRIAPPEREIVRRMAEEVTCCQLMVVCHASRLDIEQAIGSLQGARGGRILLIAPTSEAVSQSLLQRSAAESLQHTRDMVRFARDLDSPVRVDVALVDAPRADLSLVTDAANVLSEAGGSAMVLCDTVGSCTPLQTRRMAKAVVAGCDPSVLLGIHIHNDLGFGLASTFEAIACGIRYVTSSWLGLAERTGMAATEQVLVALASEPEAIQERYGIRTPVWQVPPRLDDLVPLAQDIATWLDIPLKVTDPVVGTGVNSISTGTPFRDPLRFVPYDAEALLGIPRRIVVTQLASRRVIREAALDAGASLSPAQVDLLTRRVKELCYERSQSIVPPSEFAELLRRITEGGATDTSSFEALSAVRAAELPRTSALPLDVMAAAARELPESLAWFDGRELMLSIEAAEAYQRVVQTDFSCTAWQLDRPEDAETAAMWLGLGGSFLADFASAPGSPRIFAWILSPVPEAAQHALKVLKGRDGRWVPTSLVTAKEELLSWLDPRRCHLDPAALDAVLDLGPVGVRFAVRPGAVPSYFVHRGLDGASAQVVLPGRSEPWRRWLDLLRRLTGHRLAGATSANFSGLGREALSGGTHKDLAELQADMGYLGLPILSGPVDLDGMAVPPEQRADAYKQLNRPFLRMDPEQRAQSTALLPTSLSVLGITADPAHWDLLRHGSLQETVLRSSLAAHGLRLEHRTGDRLELSRYVGDLLAALPLFSGLGVRHIAEISQLVEPLTFTSDEILVRKGDPADRMYFVASGTVAVEVEPEVRLAAGDFFGEVALVEDVRRTATVRGVEPGVLLVLTAHVLHRLMEEFPPLADPIRRSARARLATPQT